MFTAAKVPQKHAVLMADSFVASNLRGVDSHGIQLLPLYIEALGKGNVDVTAEGHVVSESGAVMVYDGDNGIGQVTAAHCCDHVVRLGAQYGMGFVTARGCNHFGAAAYWASRIAAAGQVGIVVCNATSLVAPWQGREPRMGTNPICMAVPGPKTWLLDMATTTVAMNRIWKAAALGETELPDGWAMDKDGVPTTKTQDALEGLPMPLGGYKGSGLAMMVEILCAAMSGGAMSTEVGGLRVTNRPMRVGHAFLSIDVSRLMPVEEFGERMQRLRGMIKNTAPAKGYDEVLVAGDPEWRFEEERRRTGIPIAEGTWKVLGELAQKFEVSLPPSRPAV
jgi:LDH2 family malate/lactate/ureidoglycolate dehydrogenase